jgi:hypothetical protein
MVELTEDNIEVSIVASYGLREEVEYDTPMGQDKRLVVELVNVEGLFLLKTEDSKLYSKLCDPYDFITKEDLLEEIERSL